METVARRWRKRIAIAGIGESDLGTVPGLDSFELSRQATLRALAIIDLEEGPRMMSNVTGIPADQVRVGMPVQVYFDKVTEESPCPNSGRYKRRSRR